MKQKLASSIPATLLSILVVAPSTMQGPPPPVQDPSKGSTTGATTGGAGITSNPPAGGAAPGVRTTGGQFKATGGKPANATPPKPPKPPWQEFKLDPKTTIFLDFTESSPDLVLSMLSRTSGITIVRDPSFKFPITVTSAKSVKLDEAFEILNTVLGLNNYELRKQGNLLVVGKKTPPQPQMPTVMPAPPPDESPVLKVYKLEFANASQVSRVINEVFSQQALEQMIQQLQGGGGFNPGGPSFGRPGGPQQPKAVRASSEDYSNSVIVNAPPKYQTDVEKLIKELDKTTDKPLESEVFKLQYVGVDDVVDAIQNVLTANKPTGKGAQKSQDNQNSMYGFYGYNPFGGQNRSSGGETVVAIKPTNSVIVSATKANMEIVRELVKNLDQESAFVGTTSVIHLENAKATEVATLLNQAFTKRRDQNQDDNPFFFYFSDYGDNRKKNDTPTDIDENGRVVNVRDLTGKVNVMADPNTNSLIVVTLPSNLKLIRKIVDQIDRISDQVMIETVIVEANLDKTTKLGIEWNFLQSKVLGNNGTSGSGSSNFGLQGGTSSPQGFTYTLTGRDYRVFLNALQTDTRFKVLSTPRIFTSNNVKAEINVSQQVPYITSQQTGAVGNLISQYDFKSVGVILTVTPRITSAGEVSMDVIQSADDLQGFTTFNAPIINHRQASTTASVKDGETIVLGGIIRTTYNNTSNKVPILGDIPLLGNLFKSSTKQVAQTELMVLLTPHIVRNSTDAARLKEEELKRLSGSSQDAVKKLVPPPGG